jgi:hypothetical protein
VCKSVDLKTGKLRKLAFAGDEEQAKEALEYMEGVLELLNRISSDKTLDLLRSANDDYVRWFEEANNDRRKLAALAWRLVWDACAVELLSEYLHFLHNLGVSLAADRCVHDVVALLLKALAGAGFTEDEESFVARVEHAPLSEERVLSRIEKVLGRLDTPRPPGTEAALVCRDSAIAALEEFFADPSKDVAVKIQLQHQTRNLPSQKDKSTSRLLLLTLLQNGQKVCVCVLCVCVVCVLCVVCVCVCVRASVCVLCVCV